MSWIDRLEHASWKGFTFLTDSHEASAGRRLVVHEFPGAEEPIVEDLGGKAREWRVTAYFIGPDYDLQRNKLLALLAQDGADWLTHPWLGRLWARPQEWSVSESNERGGMAVVSIRFVAGGRAPSVPQVDMADAALGAARKASTAVVQGFDLAPMPADVLTRWVAAVQGELEVLRKVVSLSALPVTWAHTVSTQIAGLKGDLRLLAAQPQAYANALQSIANALGATDGVEDDARPRVVGRLASASLKGRTAGSDALTANLAAEALLRRRLLAVAAAEAAIADYLTAADRDTALAAALAALDALLPTAADEVFDALLTLRTSLLDALMAQDLAPADVRDVVAPMPATVLAHRLEADEAVFLRTNNVIHPLFVAGRIYG
jgi:prophage DNA circulation protein